MRDAIDDQSEYADYEELSRKYPETCYAHRERFLGFRFWTVMHELTPYAKKSKKLVDLDVMTVFILFLLFDWWMSLGIAPPSLVARASKKAQRLKLQCRL